VTAAHPQASELLVLADTVKTERHPDAHTCAAILAAFGLHQVYYPRAGWKFIYPDSGRPGSPLSPTLRLDDFVSMLKAARQPVPEFIPSDPRKACVQALRALATGGGV
jgi:hypothetical protein